MALGTVNANKQGLSGIVNIILDNSPFICIGTLVGMAAGLLVAVPEMLLSAYAHIPYYGVGTAILDTSNNAFYASSIPVMIDFTRRCRAGKL